MSFIAFTFVYVFILLSSKFKYVSFISFVFSIFKVPIFIGLDVFTFKESSSFSKFASIVPSSFACVSLFTSSNTSSLVFKICNFPSSPNISNILFLFTFVDLYLISSVFISLSFASTNLSSSVISILSEIDS